MSACSSQKEADAAAKEALRQWGPETPRFSLSGTKCWARIVGIYDADTLTIVIPTFGVPFKYSVRLNGIDTCEIKAKSEICRELAIKARNRVFTECTNLDYNESWKRKDLETLMKTTCYLVWIECDGMDMYGRVLADIFVKGKSLSKMLLEERLAYAYYGEKKLSEDEQIKRLTC